jgi:hypothetical protein
MTEDGDELDLDTLVDTILEHLWRAGREMSRRDVRQRIDSAITEGRIQVNNVEVPAWGAPLMQTFISFAAAWALFVGSPPAPPVVVDTKKRRGGRQKAINDEAFDTVKALGYLARDPSGR